MPDTIVSEHIVINGRLIPREQGHISIFNQALFYSFGVYESVQIEGGAAFHLEDHVGRLFQSAAMIELPLPYRPEEIQGWIERLVEADQIGQSLLRVLAFGPNGDEESLVYVLPMALPRYPDAFYSAGASAITFEGERPLPAAKTLNTLVNYLALRRAGPRGAPAALRVVPQGRTAAGARPNLFVVMDGRLVTPPAGQALSGITRELVCEMAGRRGIEVQERPIQRAELDRAGEVFVTSTSMHVMPITRIDALEIGEGRVGPVTRTLMHDFEEYYAGALRRQPAVAIAME